MGRFADKVIVITGASSGIGAALARQLYQEGGRILLLARRTERLLALQAELDPSGSRIKSQACDVLKSSDLEGAMAKAIAEFGRIDIIVANAGFGVAGSFNRLSLEDYHRQFNTNVFGVVATLKAALAEVRANHGQMVIMGSVAGYLSLPNHSAYAMSKFALRSLAESLYYEFRPLGVAVTLISPGYVESEIQQVDNQGVFDAARPKRLPAWLYLSAPKAARDMSDAIFRRQREAIITGHGKLLVLLVRFAPGLLRLVLTYFSRRKPVAGSKPTVKSSQGSA